MESKVLDKNALTEVYIILTSLGLYSRIPEEFQKFIFENKNNNYLFTFNQNVPLFEQLNNDTTCVLLSYIYTKYINDSVEKEIFLLSECLKMNEMI